MTRRLPERSRIPSIRTVLGLLLLAALVYGVTAIPYLLAVARAPAGMTFCGTLIWTPDQDCYFSFIRQSADGHVLFLNRLTSLEHSPVYFNLEWLLVGRILALFHGSTAWAYQIWRAGGAVAVVFGSYGLVRVAIRDPRLRRIALFMLLFGGTFRTLFLGLNALSRGAESLLGWHLGALSTDFDYFAAHPFAQVLANPHFSCALGVFLLAIAAYIQGERRDDVRWTVIASVLAAIEASMRPYEMIVLYTFIPLFILIELVVARRFEGRRLLRRALPLVVVAPVFLYTIFIFELHPVFKYWASQGISVPISIPETLAHMGLAGVLLLVRGCCLKAYPLSSPIERLLLAWLLCVLLFIHGDAVPFLRFMPYTPQLITSLLPSVILLGVPVLDRTRGVWTSKPLLPWIVVVGAILGADSLDSVLLLRRLTPRSTPSGESDRSELYVASTEMQAFRWLDREASESDVVLCSGKTGHRLSKNASVRVISGHWSVTPKSDEAEINVERFFRGKLSPAAVADLLEQDHVRWIYFGRMEGRDGEALLRGVPGFSRRFVNEDVTVYGPGP